MSRDTAGNALWRHGAPSTMTTVRSRAGVQPAWALGWSPCTYCEHVGRVPFLIDRYVTLFNRKSKPCLFVGLGKNKHQAPPSGTSRQLRAQ